MTVSRAISSLFLFQSKIEEAVNLVPGMYAEDKLKAVHFWNLVSEKLQDIVNSSAADINAIALKMDEEENAKMNLAMSSEETILQHDGTPAVAFSNMSSGFSMCNETSVDLHTSNDLKTFVQESTSFPESSKQSSNDRITNLPHIHSLNSLNSDISSSKFQNDHYLGLDIPDNNCDTFSKDLQSSSHMSILGDVCDNHDSDMTFSSSKRDIQAQPWTDKNDEDFETNSDVINHKSPTKTETSFTFDDDSFPQNHCSVSTNSINNNSVDKCSLESAAVLDLEASNESNFEHIDGFDASSSEDIFQTSEISQSHDAVDVTLHLTCNICSKLFGDEDSLARHHLKVHERHYSCTECKAKFTTKGNLIVHMRRHTGEKPFCCNKCPANFTTKGNLQRHIKTHTGEKPWECNKCGTCFTEKKSLTIHMRRHTGERPYQCKECGKRFSQSSILQTHMAMHMDLKIHLCEKCGKSFRQKSQLRIHRLRHDNVRPYLCTSCTASFLTRGDLIRHEKIHTREKPFVCDMCTKSFTRQQSLNEHKNRHYGLKPYKCKHCGKAYAEMSGCYKHMKYHVKETQSDSFNASDLLEQVMDTPQTVQSEPSDNDAVENQLPSTTDPSSYITVVLNTKDSSELSEEINSSVSFFNSSIEEPNGVLSAINILTNSSTIPENFQNIS